MNNAPDHLSTDTGIQIANRACLAATLEGSA
jgi:hypothetical protein